MVIGVETVNCWGSDSKRKSNSANQKENVMTQHTALGETQTADAILLARARLVVPGGMWGHLNGGDGGCELEARSNR